MVLRASAGVVWCCRGRAGAETGSEQRLLASALFPHAYGWTAASAPLRRSDERSESGATSTCIDAKGPNCKCAAPVELAVGKTLANKPRVAKTPRRLLGGVQGVADAARSPLPSLSNTRRLPLQATVFCVN